MLKYKIYPYKIGSASAKELANALDIKRVRADGRYRYYPNHIIINWGNSIIPSWYQEYTKFLNHPLAVAQSSNKKTALSIFKLPTNFIAHPIFFTNKQDLIHYTESLDSFPTIYCRKTLTGHSGDGIILANDVSEIVDAPLYTIRFKATKEWRVHVFKDQVIDFSKKSRRVGVEERPSGLIRNYASGWVFCREGLQLPNYLADESIKAIKALGLDFGAVDIAEDRDGNVCCYEVNTACGLCGTTISSYANAFRRYLNECT